MTAPRIALDVTAARLGQAGSAVYITSLQRALDRVLGDRLHVIASRWAAPLGARRTLADRARTLVRDLWWHQVGVSRAARRAGCGLLHMPAGLGPVRSSVPLVVTVLDFAVGRFPHMFRPWHRTYGRLALRGVTRAARAVIAISHATKRDLVDRLGIPEERITVVPLGADPVYAPLPRNSERAREVRHRYALPERFVLTVGAIEPRKNLKRLFEAVRRVATRPDARDIALIHAGPDGWLADDVPRAAHAIPDGRVRFLGYVSAPDLAVLYGLASCLAYPSLWEGFGLPVLEAMACGCPVLTSRVSALPELAGDAALLVEPTSTEEISDGLGRLWSDGTLCTLLSQRGIERAGQFTWERAARQTVAVYDAALS